MDESTVVILPIDDAVTLHHDGPIAAGRALARGPYWQNFRRDAAAHTCETWTVSGSSTGASLFDHGREKG